MLSALLLAASFAPFSSPTCGWIALIPAWWLLTRSAEVQARPFRYGYLAGVIFFGCVFWWISNVTAIGAFFLVFYLALYPALWFLFVTRLIQPRADATLLAICRNAIGAAALWVMLEWWRGWFLTGFNWNELGISQSTSIVFRQLAAYGGVHLISFVLVVVNILWAEGVLGIIANLRTKRAVRPTPTFALALFVVAFTFALSWHHLQRHQGEPLSPRLKFTCIQPNIPQIPYDSNKPYKQFEETELEALDRTEKLTLSALVDNAKPDLLIWPEAMIDQGVFQDRPMNEAVMDICHAYGGYFLLGSQDFVFARKDSKTKPKLYNAAYFFSPHGDHFEEYRKTRLVILGEFLPFGNAFPQMRHWLGIGMDFTPGPGPQVFQMQTPQTKFAPLICFEDTLPDVANQAVKLGPDFFVTITNDGWYQGWCAQWGIRQHLAHAVFRSIEHDRPMIRCANTGISDLVDQNGTVVDRFRGPLGEEVDVGGVFTRSLEFYPAHTTLYESWGEWIVLISALVSVMLGIRFFLPSPMNPEPFYSVVVPFYNEADNLPRLIDEIDGMLRTTGQPAEIILVNDGSTDTYAQPATSPAYLVRWLSLSKNSGQSAAMYYGMQKARGQVVILLDADLQNDPQDVPRMLQKLETDKLDLVTGVRVKRNDNFIRRASSSIANAVRSYLLQDHTSDTGCTLKVIRREAAQRLPGWNGMHRFIPALVLSGGYKIGEMPVEHRARYAGVSKVAGGKRAVRATIDLLGMLWLSRRTFKGRLLPEKD